MPGLTSSTDINAFKKVTPTAPQARVTKFIPFIPEAHQKWFTKKQVWFLAIMGMAYGLYTQGVVNNQHNDIIAERSKQLAARTYVNYFFYDNNYNHLVSSPDELTHTELGNAVKSRNFTNILFEQENARLIDMEQQILVKATHGKYRICNNWEDSLKDDQYCIYPDELSTLKTIQKNKF